MNTATGGTCVARSSWFAKTLEEGYIIAVMTLRTLELFRRIAVPPHEADSIRKNALDRGVELGSGQWTMAPPDLRPQRPRLGALAGQPQLSTKMTRAHEAHAICACGDRESAKYYATIHNRTSTNTVGLIMQMTVPIDRIWIDGRDLLYTVFPLLPEAEASRREQITAVLDSLFGERIRFYIDSALAGQPTPDRFLALVDLAVNDPTIIEAHHRNSAWIFGRHGTCFRSAFQTEAPLPPEVVTSAEICSEFTRPRKGVQLLELIP